MSALALVGYVLFLAVTLGWRSWLQHRRTGDWGFRGFSVRSPEIVGGALLVLGAVASFLAPAFDLLGILEPAAALALPAVHLAGLSCMGLGFVLTLVAQMQMGASWRVGVDPTERTRLVTDGVFRHVRNPIFTGMLIALLGVLLLVPNLLAVAGVVLATVGLELHVRRIEEPYLVQTHGEDYRRYASSAGRFLPWLGRLR